MNFSQRLMRPKIHVIAGLTVREEPAIQCFYDAPSGLRVPLKRPRNDRLRLVANQDGLCFFIHGYRVVARYDSLLYDSLLLLYDSALFHVKNEV